MAIASSGLHSNGYSLVRRVIASAGWSLDRHVDEFGRTLGEELLEPTRLYTQPVLDLIRLPDLHVHALSHVTGGGLAANLARVLPPGTLATDRAVHLDSAARLRDGPAPRPGTPDRPRTHPQPRGGVPRDPARRPGRPRRRARGETAGIPAWVLGEVTTIDRATTTSELVSGAKGVDGGAVQVLGEHPDA